MLNHICQKLEVFYVTHEVEGVIHCTQCDEDILTTQKE
jgi:hypothetical protein